MSEMKEHFEQEWVQLRERFEKMEQTGCRYYGKVHDGLEDGPGQMDYADGSSYRGFYRQGMREGYGVFTAFNGTITEGTWLNDLEEGKMIRTSPLKNGVGQIYTSIFSQGIDTLDGAGIRKDYVLVK